MTRPYDWNPMPHTVSVKCPKCSGAAQFEFAEVVKIELKNDVEYFKNSDVFEYEFFQDSTGSRWHGAIYYHGLAGNSLESVSNLPEGYTPERGAHSEYQQLSLDNASGAIVCTACDFREKHQLDWPSDAYFQIDYKGQVLWAFHRESTVELLDFVRSENRNRDGYVWRNFLMHVPSHFLNKKARDTVSKKLNKLLSSGGR